MTSYLKLLICTVICTLTLGWSAIAQNSSPKSIFFIDLNPDGEMTVSPLSDDLGSIEKFNDVTYIYTTADYVRFALQDNLTLASPGITVEAYDPNNFNGTFNRSDLSLMTKPTDKVFRSGNNISVVTVAIKSGGYPAIKLKVNSKETIIRRPGFAEWTPSSISKSVSATYATVLKDGTYSDETNHSNIDEIRVEKKQIIKTLSITKPKNVVFSELTFLDSSDKTVKSYNKLEECENSPYKEETITLSVNISDKELLSCDKMKVTFLKLGENAKRDVSEDYTIPVEVVSNTNSPKISGKSIIWIAVVIISILLLALVGYFIYKNLLQNKRQTVEEWKAENRIDNLTYEELKHLRESLLKEGVESEILRNTLQGVVKIEKKSRKDKNHIYEKYSIVQSRMEEILKELDGKPAVSAEPSEVKDVKEADTVVPTITEAAEESVKSNESEASEEHISQSVCEDSEEVKSLKLKVSVLESEIENKDKEIANLNTKINKIVEEDKIENQRLNGEINQLKEDLDSKSKSLEEEKKNYQDLKEKLEIEKGEVKKHLETIEQIKLNVNKERSALVEKLKIAISEAHKEAEKDKQELIAKHEEEISGLKTEISSLESSMEDDRSMIKGFYKEKLNYVETFIEQIVNDSDTETSVYPVIEKMSKSSSGIGTFISTCDAAISSDSSVRKIYGNIRQAFIKDLSYEMSWCNNLVRLYAYSKVDDPEFKEVFGYYSTYKADIEKAYEQMISLAEVFGITEIVVPELFSEKYNSKLYDCKNEGLFISSVYPNYGNMLSSGCIYDILKVGYSDNNERIKATVAYYIV